MVTEFEADWTRQRAREGLQVAAAKGRLKAPSPEAVADPATAPGEPARRTPDDGTLRCTVGKLAELLGVERATVYHAVDRAE
jgi:DNA invertase Pin-like site-specific DNA recombinase